MTPQEVLSLDATTQVVDVRDADELTSGVVPGAVHIPLHELSSRLSELRVERAVVTVCQSGRRSELAAAQLVAAGYSARSMAGGMKAWQAAGLPFSHPSR